MKRHPFTVDLLHEMHRAAGQKTIDQVMRILSEHEDQREAVKQRLVVSKEIAENRFDITQLDHTRIFHLDQIRKICIDHRLRFLNSSYFKDGIPAEALNKIQQLERTHQTEISGFKIAAPSKAFALKNINDPLLFVPVSNGYYYLVHQWGKELSVWRKWLCWPVRNIGNFLVSCIVISIVFTMLIPSGELDRRVPMAKIIVFLFAFKSFFAAFLYSFYILGKRFSSNSWESPYFNS
ncbi:hypothetical protein [Flavobacterium silvaticum]|uniref:Uncharacterized protein n=1 Tax=Flavobacterium silvaticum TaxID=1852020 RepID=A0A972JKB3_9FLAO|nr:hypothetical protein [Flavobacterium silvaticum]NMH28962.1 hypothetical protein [Flavobacterium silvaticum]